MKVIVAIIRTTCLRRVVEELKNIKIRNMTITEVKGTGEQVTIHKLYAIHNMIQIIVPDEKVDKVTNVILQQAHSGLPGDGMIAVIPVDYMIKIRTKEKFE